MNDIEFGQRAVMLERAEALVNVFVNLCLTENPYTCKTIEKDLVSVSCFADAVAAHTCVLEAASDIIKSVTEDLWKCADCTDEPSATKKGAA